MLKQCLENIGEGLLHACISSILLFWRKHSGLVFIANTIINTVELKLDFDIRLADPVFKMDAKVNGGISRKSFSK
jgi:hypothetical protein